jgi:Spy/CpxP family protein refolding chaperone
MKSTIQGILAAVAVGTLGIGAVGMACAQSAPAAPTTTGPQHFHHRGHFGRFGGSRFVGSLLRATRQLNLTPGQQQSIKTIMATARTTQHHAQQTPTTVLGNPGDQGFPAAVQGAANDAVTRVHNESLLASQIYGVLTPQQIQLLPGVLASIQAKEQARRAAWATKHNSGNG